MNITEVRKKHKEIEERLKKNEREKRNILQDWEDLRGKCSHPKKHRYSSQGETGWYCPDCGWQT